MPRQRVVAIGLDGLEVTLAERLMAAGEMPALSAFRARSARFLLDHGPAQFTGLGWEHLASGLSPEAGRRWGAVEFDPATYRAWYEGARFDPWWTTLDRKIVVFDTPYVDLRRARNTRGLVAWGAHDPGTVAAARPHDLLADFRKRFGRYPSKWTYGMPWPSAVKTQEMGDALTSALETRAHAARWLATERLPDWDFFFAVAGEMHGAIEGLWHGIDPSHPLHRHPSAPASAKALVDIHRALDGMVDEIVRAAGDAAVVAFTMGGMGPNHSDAQSMVLLAELLYRHAFGRPLLRVPPEWARSPQQVPILAPDDTWDGASSTWVPRRPVERARFSAAMDSGLEPWPRLRAGLKGVHAAMTAWRAAGATTAREILDWQPAARYAESWPQMSAFALPSFYDGRVRINLKGRERNGIVEPSRYDETCRQIETLVRECRNPLTGESAVERVERASTRDPLALEGSEADVVVVWRGIASALEHPRLGLIGPIALRRTGGHTGRHGLAYIVAPGVRPGDHGVRSSFDVAPTLVQLLGCAPIPGMTGTALSMS